MVVGVEPPGCSRDDINSAWKNLYTPLRYMDLSVLSAAPTARTTCGGGVRPTDVMHNDQNNALRY
jgi:hypothetical protein